MHRLQWGGVPGAGDSGHEALGVLSGHAPKTRRARSMRRSHPLLILSWHHGFNLNVALSITETEKVFIDQTFHKNNFPLCPSDQREGGYETKDEVMLEITRSSNDFSQSRSSKGAGKEQN